MLRYLLLFGMLTLFAMAQPQQAPSQREVKSYSLPPDKLKKAIDYAAARNRMHFLSAAYGFLVLGCVLAWRIAPRFRDWAERISRWRIAQAFIFGTLLVLVVDVASLPLSMVDHHLSVKYEQSVQGWGSWFWDWTKGELIGFVLTGFLIWMLYGVIRRSPRRWWFYFWLISIPLLLFILFITPVLIEPLFFKFSPLEATQPALVSELGKVVARGGLEIPRDRMFEMNASQKLNSLNAYVAGLGASKRVVVWDTTLQKMTTPQILFVFGHEMGHYVLNHIWVKVAVSCCLIFAFLLVAYYAMQWTVSRWGAGWGIRSVDDWASLPILMLVAAVLGFLAEPMLNSFSRTLEHNADIYGLEVIHGIVANSSQAAAEAFQILGEVSLSDPNPSPFIEFWLYDHPSVSDRVRFAAEYDPWDKGGTPVYLH